MTPTDDQLGPLPERRPERGVFLHIALSPQEIRTIQRDTWARAWEACLASLGVANGYSVVAVKNIGPLIDALERADRKGYMPDAMADEWAAFDYAELAPAALAPVPEHRKYKCPFCTQGWVPRNPAVPQKCVICQGTGATPTTTEPTK